jgi:predicted metal-dependent peptidase
MQSEAMKRMIAARAALVLDEPFWGTLALRLQLQEDPTCETAWVNGRDLGFNPAYVQGLPTAARVKALVGHEVVHCVLGHPWRRDGRDLGRWNEAADRVGNPILRDAKFDLPEDVLYELEPAHRGKSTEWVYNRLPQPQPAANGDDGEQEPQDDQGDPASGQDGNGQPDDTEGTDTPSPFGGEVRDAPTASEDDQVPSEDEWGQAVQQAANLAAAQGKLPGSLARLVEQATKSHIDWHSVLWRFVQEIARSDYSWTQPNRRYLSRGLYLPALHNREVGIIAVGVDTSGSIDNTLLGMFGDALQALASEMQPRRVNVFYCDSQIQHEDVFERGDTVELHAHGGGGTSFQPVFEAVEQLDEPPVCMIYLTDLCGSFPDQPPEMPVLWVTPQRYAQSRVPFGEIVAVEE